MITTGFTGYGHAYVIMAATDADRVGDIEAIAREEVTAMVDALGFPHGEFVFELDARLSSQLNHVVVEANHDFTADLQRDDAEQRAARQEVAA